MTTTEARRVWRAFLPWLGAALLWVGALAPMRADQEDRFRLQAQVRRDRLSAEKKARELSAVGGRVARALAAACRASSAPAALRQRTVAATAGLPLSPFNLSVGGATGGAVVDAEGTFAAASALLRRLGDPARGTFLRSASLRANGARWTLSANAGALESFPRSLMTPPGICAGEPDPGAVDPEEAPSAPPRPVAAPSRPVPRVTPALEEPAPLLPPPEPPFALVGFLSAEGRASVSLSVRSEVRVVTVGDTVEGWTCVSIDRDQGVMFTSASGGRLVLKPGK